MNKQIAYARVKDLPRKPMTYKEAILFIARMNVAGFNGHSNWRLPESELEVRTKDWTWSVIQNRHTSDGDFISHLWPELEGKALLRPVRDLSSKERAEIKNKELNKIIAKKENLLPIETLGNLMYLTSARQPQFTSTKVYLNSLKELKAMLDTIDFTKPVIKDKDNYFHVIKNIKK